MRWKSDLSRQAQVARKSKETQLSARIDLDGRGRSEVATGLPFLDHMLEQVARYGGFDLRLRGAGDMHVDPHHLVEDAGNYPGFDGHWRVMSEWDRRQQLRMGGRLAEWLQGLDKSGRK